MFTAKQKNLFPVQATKTFGNPNPFIAKGMAKAATTTSGNGAVKFEKTDNAFVNQFGSLGLYKTERSFADISNDMAVLWGKNPLLAVCFIFYIRLITRVVSLFDGVKTKEVQRGAGLKHEGIMRMVWIHIYHPETFWKNITLFISIGSWNDIIKMLCYDLQFNGWNNRKLDWEKFGQVILAGLENPNHVNLVKKYLPQIKANNKCTTLDSQADNIIAKWICSLIFGNKGENSGWTYKQYRQLKTSGTAHEWQKLISNKSFLKIDFNTIHGRALSKIVSSKFLKNNGLEEAYAKWIANKPAAKFTGYVHELAALITPYLEKYKADTINAQYKTLLETAGKTNSNLIVVKDTSTSMNSPAYGTNMSSYNVAKAMSIFLANLLKGWFHNHYIDFSAKAVLRAVEGSNFVEHWNTEKRIASANTNFMGVAELLLNIKGQGVEEKDFPAGIVCISDGEFDKVKMYDKANIIAFKQLLAIHFSKEFVRDFKFVFWDVHNTFYGNNRKTKFETYTMVDNVFYFSGYDPSVITFLTGVEGKSAKLPSNAEELFLNAMDQQTLNMIEI